MTSAIKSEGDGMETKRLPSEIIATYQKHGWKLKRVLLRTKTQEQLGVDAFEGIPIEEAEIDGLWFTRPSFSDRQAWELRLLAETTYALFETFAADEPADRQNEIRREMEQRLFEAFFAKPKEKRVEPW